MPEINYNGVEYDSIDEAEMITGENYATIWRNIFILKQGFVVGAEVNLSDDQTLLDDELPPDNDFVVMFVEPEPYPYVDNAINTVKKRRRYLNRNKARNSDTVSTPHKPVPTQKRPKYDLKAKIKPFEAHLPMGALYNVLYGDGEDHNLHLCAKHHAKLIESGIAINVHRVKNAQASPCIWCKKEDKGK